MRRENRLSTAGASSRRARWRVTSAMPMSQAMWRASAASSSPRRSEEHTSELQSLMRISYAVFCLKKKRKKTVQSQERQRNKQNNYTETRHTPNDKRKSSTE